MLKPITKASGTTKREAYLAKLADDTFLGLWSFPNIWRDEGLTQNGTGKEVADLIVYFEDTLIIFSDKNIAFKDNADIEVSWHRWFRQSVLESATQLWGAESHIKKYPNRLFLDKECTENFPHTIDTSKLKIHLIAVTFNSYAPSKKYFDSFKVGSSGSLMCHFDLPTSSIKKHPFCINDLDKKKTFVHILDEMTLDLLLKELNTVSDFIHYLECKEKAIRKERLISAAGEEDILSIYLEGRYFNRNGYGFIPKAEAGKLDIVAIREGEWATFANSINYLRHREAIRSGLEWSEIIKELSNGILTAEVGEAIHLPFLSHERAVRFLASENTLSRALLAKNYKDKFNTVPTSARSARLVESISHPDRIYILLFLPKPSSISYDEYRIQRINFINAYTLVAKLQFDNVKEVIILARETKGNPGSSLTVAAMDTSIPLSKDEIRTAKHMMKHEKILSNYQNTKPQPKSPENQTGYFTRTKHPRNAPCRCGSGIKSKKCCQ